MNKISQGIEELLNMYKSYKISPEQAISDQYDFLIDQIKDETDASVLIHALDKDISDLMYLDVYFMFFCVQKSDSIRSSK